MKYRILERPQYPLWDEFVDSSPQGSIYSKSFYLDSIGCSYSIGVVEDDNRIIGGIVLAKNEVNVFSNPLFVKFLGILYGPVTGRLMGYQSQTYKIDKEIISQLRGWNVWSYCFHPCYNNWLNFYWNGYKQTTRYTYQIDFSKTPDFRMNYGGNVKGHFKTAQKHNLMIDDIDFEKFAEVNAKTYEEQSKRAPYSKKKLITVLYNLAEHNCLYAKAVKDCEGNVHSVAAVVYDRRSANLILNGTDPGYKQFSGNTLLIDHMIDFASKNCGIFDFEGSMHERIEKFYRDFGGNITSYCFIYKANLPTLLYHCLLDTAKKWS
jgi:hypothetical protein